MAGGAKLRRSVAPALRTLREYWGTAVLAAVTGALALAAALPVTGLAGRDGGSRLHVGADVPFDAGFLWAHAAPGPAALRQGTVLFLYQLLLGVAVGLVVVALLTLFSLFVARASARAPEIALKRAVGASSRHLLAAQLVEGAMLSAAAVALGGGIGLAVARAVGAAWPGSLGAGTGSGNAMTILIVVAATLLGALLPVALVRRPARSTGVDPTPLALVVPALQLGLSLTVLAAAAQLKLGADRTTARTGTTHGTGQVYEVNAAGLSLEQRSNAYAALLARLRGERAVVLTSLASPGALVGLGRAAVVLRPLPGSFKGQIFTAVHHLVSADSFQALGLRVLAGRALTDADSWNAPRVAIVSRALGTRLFGPRAVGSHLYLGVGPGFDHTIVGVVDDAQPVGLGGTLEPKDVIYVSVLQHPAAGVELLVRGDPGRTAAVVVGAMQTALGPGVSESGPVSEASLFDAEAAPLRWFARVFSAEGWVMLALATFGTFAVMWLWVASLLGALGLRRAVGARRRDIVRFVLGRAVGVAVAGVAFGAWVGMMVWDALQSSSDALPAWDPGSVVRSGLLLAVAALAGAFIPAWRAARTPPATLIQSAG